MIWILNYIPFKDFCVTDVKSVGFWIDMTWLKSGHLVFFIVAFTNHSPSAHSSMWREPDRSQWADSVTGLS